MADTEDDGYIWNHDGKKNYVDNAIEMMRWVLMLYELDIAVRHIMERL